MGLGESEHPQAGGHEGAEQDHDEEGRPQGQRDQRDRDRGRAGVEHERAVAAR